MRATTTAALDVGARSATQATPAGEVARSLHVTEATQAAIVDPSTHGDRGVGARPHGDVSPTEVAVIAQIGAEGRNNVQQSQALVDARERSGQRQRRFGSNSATRWVMPRKTGTASHTIRHGCLSELRHRVLLLGPDPESPVPKMCRSSQQGLGNRSMSAGPDAATARHNGAQFEITQSMKVLPT